MSNWHLGEHFQRHQRWIQYQNDSEETIPEFATMVSTGIDVTSGHPIVKMMQPAGGNNEAYFFNSEIGPATGGFGSATHDFPTIARYSGTDAPVVGQEWGPKSGQWELDTAGSGFVVVSPGTAPDANNKGIVLVVEKAGGTPGCDFIRFKITDSDSKNKVAVGEVLSRPCGCSTVIGEEDGRVNLVDKAGCFLVESDDRLRGIQGFAKLLQENESSGSIGSLSLLLSGSASLACGPEDCCYEIVSICCERECGV